VTRWSRLADLLVPPTVTTEDVWQQYGWSPHPKQAIAEHLATSVDELLYGGAAGGGKSDWLLLHAVSEMEAHPGNRGVIFRRVMPSLVRSLWPRAVTILHGRADINKNEHTFTFPNSSVLEFGHLEHVDSVHRYQGAEYGFIGFEEVTEFLESQWEYMRTRLRAPAPGVRPHMVATANPGGVGHTWVKRRWVAPKVEDVNPGSPVPAPGVVWQATPPAGVREPRLRGFVPATLADNPTLTERDPQYAANLASIGNRALRLAMQTGDWDAIDAIEGALWSWDWIEPRRMAPGSVEGYIGGLVRVVTAVDPAGSTNKDSDETGIVTVGKGSDGRGYVLNDASLIGTPGEWAATAVNEARRWQADALVVERNYGGDMARHTLAQIAGHMPIIEVNAKRGKVLRAEPIAHLYEQGRVSHLGTFPELESQQTTWVPSDSDSPDRVDALVHGLTELFPVAGPVTVTRYRNTALTGTR
jgi:hypothetical protein